MRIKLRRVVKQRGDKTYTSYVLTIPKDVVELLSLSGVEEVEMNVKTVDGEIALVITKPKEARK